MISVQKIYTACKSSINWLRVLEFVSEKRYEEALRKLEKIDDIGSLTEQKMIVNGLLLLRIGRLEEAVDALMAAYRTIEKSTQFSDDERVYLKCYVSVIGEQAARECGNVHQEPFNIDYNLVSLENVTPAMKMEHPLKGHPDWVDEKISVWRLLGMGRRISPLRERAERGDAEAQFLLARNIRSTDGDTPDYATSVDWFRKAAEQGHAEAQFNLAYMYDKAQGVDQDDATAFTWYRGSAEQGHALAQCYVGVFYAMGRTVDQDYAEAANWFRMAAEQGQAAAQYNLGVAYDKGRGVTQNDVEAAMWYRKAAEQGDTKSQHNIAVFYSKGRGVAQDDVEAVKWYRKASLCGVPAAQKALGNCYERGRGVAQDNVLAYAWLSLAAESGHDAAKRRLDHVAEKMLPGEIAEAKRKAHDLARSHS